jgi:hypothetical protein
MEGWLLVVSIFGAMALWRVLLKLWPKDPHWAGMVASAIVIALSIRTLLAEPADSLTFRLHVLLIVAMVALIGVHLVKLRKRRT